MATRGPRVTRWCFTENNLPGTLYINLEAMHRDNENIKYICGQLELATTGQRHLQGYVQLEKKQYLSWVKKNISMTAHWERQLAPCNETARDYCRKEETAIADYPFVEYGTFTTKAGQRNDIIKFKDQILGQKRQIDLLDSFTMEMARYPKFYQMVRSLKRPRRESDLVVRLNYGSTGTGKTRYCYDTYPDLYAVPQNNGTLWYDGYDLHDTVLIDDFAGKMSKLPLTSTLQLLDRYPIQLPVKGGFTWWIPTTIIITTNIHPREWYDWFRRESQWPALKRRFTEIWVYLDDQSPIHLSEIEREEWFEKSSTTYII